MLAAELVGQPGIDCAEVRAGGSFGVVQQPLDLGRGEVRVEHEAGPLPDHRLVAGRPELFAPAGATSVLPDQGVVNRPAGHRVPPDHRLALVCYADRLEPATVDPGSGQSPPGNGPGHIPDLAGVVLDPPRPGEVLAELGVAPSDHLSLVVEYERGRAGGSLIDRQNHRLVMYTRAKSTSWRKRWMKPPRVRPVARWASSSSYSPSR